MQRASVLVLFGVAVAGAGPVAAGDTQCMGVLTGAHDNVIVPSGSHCQLGTPAGGTTVKGNVLVLLKASLRADNTMIGGNVQGDNSRFVCLNFGTRVAGNFQVKGGDFGTTTGYDINSRVMGDTKIEGNAGLTFIDAAVAGGNIDVIKNTGTIEVEHNMVGGNVKIEDNNVPAAYTGDPGRHIDPVFGCGIPTSAVLVSGGMSITDNMNGANMQVFKNVGPGFKQVIRNTVRQTLQCFENDQPFLGAPNTAEKGEGQCLATPFP